jgi:ribosomal protein L32E
MAGEKVTATKRKAGGKVVIKKRTKKFRRHQSDQFMRVPVRAPPRVLCLPQSVLCS